MEDAEANSPERPWLSLNVRQKMHASLAEFRDWVDNVYGVYLDALHGFPLVRDQQLAFKQEGATEFAYARLVKGGVAPRPIHLHQVGIDTVIERNTFGGQNAVFIGRMFIVSVYGFWDDHTREQLGVVLSIPKDQLKVPVMGDLRRMRHAIVHCRSRMDARAKKLEVLKWYSEGDVVSPTRDHVGEIMDHMLEFTRAFEAHPQRFIVA